MFMPSYGKTLVKLSSSDNSLHNSVRLNKAVRIHCFFERCRPFVFLCSDCTGDCVFKVIHENDTNCMGIFGTPALIVLAINIYT
jgi:hypothetical protein